MSRRLSAVTGSSGQPLRGLIQENIATSRFVPAGVMAATRSQEYGYSLLSQASQALNFSLRHSTCRQVPVEKTPEWLRPGSQLCSGASWFVLLWNRAVFTPAAVKITDRLKQPQSMLFDREFISVGRIAATGLFFKSG